MMKYIFGHPPSTEPGEFASKEDALHYLRTELSSPDNFRYRTTHRIRDVESIVFSFGGEMLAELVVANVSDPTDRDVQGYSKTQKVYHVSEIRIFRDLTVKAADVGLTGIQFGKQVSDDVYAQILEHVAGQGDCV